VLWVVVGVKEREQHRHAFRKFIYELEFVTKEKFEIN
jgi:hypothetical protein